MEINSKDWGNWIWEIFSLKRIPDSVKSSGLSDLGEIFSGKKNPQSLGLSDLGEKNPKSLGLSDLGKYSLEKNPRFCWGPSKTKISVSSAQPVVR